VKFEHPDWLPAGLVVCLVLIWMWRRYDARQYAALARFIAPQLRLQLTQSLSIAGRRAQRALYLAAVALAFAALAGPLVGYRWERISRRGNEIVFAIDTSRSMSTPDVKPDRLTRAKLAIDDFAGMLDGDAVGIVAFAGSAFLACPITLDYGAFRESLGAIDTHTIPRGGTNISRAIHEGQAALRRRPGSDKILILITDGEELEGDALTAAQAAWRQDGLKIYTVGVGSAAGDLIPIPADQGGGFVKDDQGNLVKSRLDEPALRAIAAAAGGVYAPLGAQGEGLVTIFKAIFGSTAKHDLAFRQQKIYIQRYQWPLSASLALLLVSLMIGTRRRSIAPRPAMAVLAVASSLLVMMPADRAFPVTVDPAAAERSPQAAAARREPKKPVVEFNRGTAAYRAGQFPQAAQSFEQSITHAPSSDLKRLADQEDAYYNLGNSLYRTGQKTEQTAPQETIQKWTEAVKAYDTALQLRTDDADSRYNRDLVKRKIDALKQKQNGGSGGGGGSNGKPPPNPRQNSNNNERKPDPKQPPPTGQPPPPSGGAGATGDPPPPQNAGQPRGEPPRQAAPPKADPDAQAHADDRAADSQRLPGRMSREEARELLDSAKGEERHALGAPLAARGAGDPPEKPFKNW